MPNLLQLEDIEIEIEYRRIKTLRLTVYPPDGRVRISAPMNASHESIRSFALSKLNWIKKHRERFRKNPRQTGNSHADGTICHVWGIPHTLKIIERQGHPKLRIQDDLLLLYIRPGTEPGKKRELLDKWYKGLMQHRAPELVAKWEPVIGVTINSIFYRKMKAHWGSCNYGKQTIRLNTELAKYPPEYLEYVVIHEMIHTIEPSHNARFYQLMNAYYPAWKTIRKAMNHPAANHG